MYCKAHDPIYLPFPFISPFIPLHARLLPSSSILGPSPIEARCVTDGGVNAACSTQAHLSLIYTTIYVANSHASSSSPVLASPCPLSPFVASLHARQFLLLQPPLIRRCDVLCATGSREWKIALQRPCTNCYPGRYVLAVDYNSCGRLAWWSSHEWSSTTTTHCTRWVLYASFDFESDLYNMWFLCFRWPLMPLHGSILLHPWSSGGALAGHLVLLICNRSHNGKLASKQT
jgi:hypothetical protein